MNILKMLVYVEKSDMLDQNKREILNKKGSDCYGMCLWCYWLLYKCLC